MIDDRIITLKKNIKSDDVIDTIGQVQTGTIKEIILGTVDAFSRTQIWNKLTNAILRLGSLGSDGDTTTSSSEGLVVYGKNLQGDAMSSELNNWSYVRLKPTRIGIYNSKADSYVGYIVKFDTTEDEWYITDNSGNKKIKISRSEGKIILSKISDGVVDISISEIITKNGINGTFTTTDGKLITVVNGQITSIS